MAVSSRDMVVITVAPMTEASQRFPEFGIIIPAYHAVTPRLPSILSDGVCNVQLGIVGQTKMEAEKSPSSGASQAGNVLAIS